MEKRKIEKKEDKKAYNKPELIRHEKLSRIIAANFSDPA